MNFVEMCGGSAPVTFGSIIERGPKEADRLDGALMALGQSGQGTGSIGPYLRGLRTLVRELAASASADVEVRAAQSWQATAEKAYGPISPGSPTGHFGEGELKSAADRVTAALDRQRLERRAVVSDVDVLLSLPTAGLPDAGSIGTSLRQLRAAYDDSPT
ncbi:MAG: hypothetical protein ACREE0_04990 [Phenylobacterium sp.]